MRLLNTHYSASKKCWETDWCSESTTLGFNASSSLKVNLFMLALWNWPRPLKQLRRCSKIVIIVVVPISLFNVDTKTWNVITARKRVIQHGCVRPRPISHPGPWPSQFTGTSGQDEGIKKSNYIGEKEQPVSDKEYDMTALSNDHSEPYQLDVHLNDPSYENGIGRWSSSVDHQHHCVSWTQTILLCSSSAAMQLRASSKPIRVKRSRCYRHHKDQSRSCPLGL